MSVDNPTIREMVNSELDLAGDMSKGVRAFIKEHLEENSFGGLMNPEVDAEENYCCGCRLDELFVSHDCYDIDECRAAYLHSDGILRLEEEGKASKGVGPNGVLGKFMADCEAMKIYPYCGADVHDGPCERSRNTVEIENIVRMKRQALEEGK